ncbi:hypothetical protein KC19_2G294900 [Ceratodon purpureus]|uniref:Uncharacterized protein n=1 Tax=Ceratodon purpureus TaxID=3225 RepID=A0A8T0J0M0_CERPU|nr:hypothetical protein KC19_2G294900 [Ceratodon purpureus]
MKSVELVLLDMRNSRFFFDVLIHSDGATLVTYGGMSKKPITAATGPFIFQDMRLRGFWLGKWKSVHSNKDFANMTNYLLELVRDGKLQYA